MTDKTTMAALGSTGGLGGALHPWCPTCGWRKGGTDSWSGKACKCGLWEPPIVRDASKEHPSDVNQPPTMRCARCRDVFERPFAEFFFRDRNGPFGWRRWCKACYSEAPSILKRSRQAAALVTPNVK